MRANFLIDLPANLPPPEYCDPPPHHASYSSHQRCPSTPQETAAVTLSAIRCSLNAAHWVLFTVHSLLSACAGSTLAAIHAGRSVARTTGTSSTTTDARYTRGSPGVTP